MISDLKIRVKESIGSLFFYLCRIFPINRRKIVFSSFLGKGYGDNGKPILEELIKDGETYDIVWLYDPRETDPAVFPDFVRLVPIKSLRAIYELSTAKIWVDNRRKPLYTQKRAGQYYMMTKHGNNGLKKVEFDVPQTLGKHYLREAKHDSDMMDVALSATRLDSMVLRSAFHINCEVLEKGLPRHDILFHPDPKLISRIREDVGIGPDEKVLLYAPTFRHKMDESGLRLYDLDWERVLRALEERLGGHWVGLMRLHPNISKMAKGLNIPPSVIDVTYYPNFDELALISDCIITDYSSTIIEGGIAGKFGFFFAVDFDKYQKERDVYIPLDEWPFPLAASNDELIRKIKDFDPEKFREESRVFFRDRLGVYETGHASEHAAEWIRQAMRR